MDFLIMSSQGIVVTVKGEKLAMNETWETQGLMLLLVANVQQIDKVIGKETVSAIETTDAQHDHHGTVHNHVNHHRQHPNHGLGLLFFIQLYLCSNYLKEIHKKIQTTTGNFMKSQSCRDFGYV